MQLGALYIDIEPLAPSKLKSMLSKEARDSRRYNHESPVRRLQRPKSASASIARKRLEQMKELLKKNNKKSRIEFHTIEYL